MGTRQGQEKQEDIWIASGDVARSPGHPFYRRLNELLDEEQFDELVEGLCRKFYAPRMGRPGLAPGIYFRSLLIGYFEGIDRERGIAWRLADSLVLRQFERIGITEQTPDHSTISRTRRLIDLETHRAVFSWVLGLLADRGLIQGKRVGVDATTLEASAAMRSIVRRDTGESYEEFLTGLARASGIGTPTREQLARLDRKRKKRTSNQEWMSPTDTDARVTKMKDLRRRARAAAGDRPAFRATNPAAANRRRRVPPTRSPRYRAGARARGERADACPLRRNLNWPGVSGRMLKPVED